MQSRSRSSRRGLPALAFALVFLALPPAAGAQEAGGAEAGPAGVVRTELALDIRPLSFAFDATLRATVPRPLLAAAESAPESRIRLGELTVNPFLNIGDLDATARREAGQPPLAGETVVWLTRADDGWALELESIPAETADAEGADEAAADAGDAVESDDGIVARVPLTREAAEPQETLSAVLVPTSDDAGRLVLRWHNHRWTAAFDLLSLPSRTERVAAAAAKAALEARIAVYQRELARVSAEAALAADKPAAAPRPAAPETKEREASRTRAILAAMRAWAGPCVKWGRHKGAPALRALRRATGLADITRAERNRLWRTMDAEAAS